MSDVLAVFLNTERVGAIRRAATRGVGYLHVSFEALPGATPLTAASEGARQVWRPAFAQNWFDGLLPDEQRRVIAEERAGVSRGDTYGLLAAIGWECAGAVSIRPEGVVEVQGRYRQLTDAEVWERVEALPRVIVDEGEVESPRSSLGGAQEKLLLRATSEGGWLLPIDGAPSTHILKPEPIGLPGLAAAEAYCLELASQVTETAQAMVMERPGCRPVLVVTRFDREITAGGEIIRLHQEDGCQVLGLRPSSKYPSTEKEPPQHSMLANILLARAADPVAEQLRLLTQLCVNAAIGNADAHAKNYSFQHVAGTIRLAPLYDACPTQALRATDRRAAMPVGGKFILAELTRANLIDEARSWGVPERAAKRVVQETLDGLEEAQGRVDPPLSLPPVVKTSVAAHIERLRSSSM